MNKDSAIDFLGYILVRLLGAVIRILPIGSSFFLGRRIGDLLFALDLKHRARAYANIKHALGDKLSPCELKIITRKFYRNFGQNIIEIFLIPLMDEKYISKYMSIEGLGNIQEGFRRGKGVIMTVVHEGGWETANLAAASLGYPYNVAVALQPKYPRLNSILNSYRRQRGAKIIQRQDNTREFIVALKRNEGMAMTVDQGGKTGILVSFFGRGASMSAGAVRLGLKYGASLIPVFSARIKGPYLKFIVEPPLEIKETGDKEQDIKDNLARLIAIYEKYLKQYPEEYLWTYKIWKYAPDKNILVLDDGKAGHLRQAEAASNIVSACLRDRGIEHGVDVLSVNFRNRFSKTCFVLGACLAGKYNCQGCLWCLKNFLKNDSYQRLISAKPDIIISCGSTLAAVNYVLSRQSLAKSIAIMRPGFLSMNRFSLVIMPRHDNPPRRKNVVVTDTALNLIDEQYLASQSEKLLQAKGLYIGLLLGGDSKKFILDKEKVREVIRQVKSAAERENAGILLTTSRRTSGEVEGIVKDELAGYGRSRLLIIANEKNIPEAVGGILGLSKVVVVSPESISMVSEAASSGRQVLVFDDKVSPKHRRFLEYMRDNGYIHLCDSDKVASGIGSLLGAQGPINLLKDKDKVRQAFIKAVF